VKLPGGGGGGKKKRAGKTPGACPQNKQELWWMDTGVVVHDPLAFKSFHLEAQGQRRKGCDEVMEGQDAELGGVKKKIGGGKHSRGI